MIQNPWSRLVRAGLVTGVIDGLFSSILSVAFYDSTVARLFQGVASALLGGEALEGGTRTALIGVLIQLSAIRDFRGNADRAVSLTS